MPHHIVAATTSGSLSMAADEELSIVDQDNGDGWTRIRKPTGEEGFVPTTYIKIHSWEVASDTTQSSVNGRRERFLVTPTLSSTLAAQFYSLSSIVVRRCGSSSILALAAVDASLSCCWRHGYRTNDPPNYVYSMSGE